MIDITHNIAFVRAQKTASTSMKLAIESLGGELAPCGIHWTAQEHIDRHPDLWRKCFSFGFVRNPWDTWVSWWSQNTDFQNTYRTFRQMILARPWEHGFRYRFAQEKFVDREGRIALTFIGRFERLEEDWGKVCSCIGRQLPLTHVNQSTHKPYREYYDNDTRAIIAELAAPDINAFGYEF